ncbi:outer membrane beta-barrel protein [Vibrio sp. TRT 21S02]|uniref:outer membrane beta-barrel protein n=1 Tax=Vibrio sp. TRT 21S02 TaxID=3418507 RepID=UPI003CEA493B
MRISSAWVMATALCLPSSVVMADSSTTNNIEYEYIHADLSSGSLNENLGENNNVTTLTIGGNYLFTDHWVASLDYSARFIHPANTTTEIYSLMPGIGYRYALIEDLDMLAQASVGYIRARTTNDITDETLKSDTELRYGTSLTLSYALNENWQASVIGELTRSDILDENLLTLRGDYKLSKRFMLGGFYTHRDTGESTTNEGGISVRFAY